jgi:hypothetical protein
MTDATTQAEKEVLNLAGKCYAIARSSTEFDPKNEIAWHLRIALAQARKETWEQAAREVENGRFLTNESPEYNFGQKVAAMLRRKAQEVPL